MTRLSLSVFALIALVTLFASSPAAQEAKGLKGIYSTMLMDEKWTIAFDGDKKFIVKKKNELMVEGTYKGSCLLYAALAGGEGQSRSRQDLPKFVENWRS